MLVAVVLRPASFALTPSTRQTESKLNRVLHYIHLSLCLSLPLCLPFCRTWSTLVSLQSVDREDLKLPQVTESISNLLTRAEDEFGIGLRLYDITRTGIVHNPSEYVQ